MKINSLCAVKSTLAGVRAQKWAISEPILFSTCNRNRDRNIIINPCSQQKPMGSIRPFFKLHFLTHLYPFLYENSKLSNVVESLKEVRNLDE